MPSKNFKEEYNEAGKSFIDTFCAKTLKVDQKTNDISEDVKNEYEKAGYPLDDPDNEELKNNLFKHENDTLSELSEEEYSMALLGSVFEDEKMDVFALSLSMSPDNLIFSDPAAGKKAFFKVLSDLKSAGHQDYSVISKKIINTRNELESNPDKDKVSKEVAEMINKAYSTALNYLSEATSMGKDTLFAEKIIDMCLKTGKVQDKVKNDLSFERCKKRNRIFEEKEELKEQLKVQSLIEPDLEEKKRLLKRYAALEYALERISKERESATTEKVIYNNYVGFKKQRLTNRLYFEDMFLSDKDTLLKGLSDLDEVQKRYESLLAAGDDLNKKLDETPDINDASNPYLENDKILMQLAAFVDKERDNIDEKPELQELSGEISEYISMDRSERKKGGPDFSDADVARAYEEKYKSIAAKFKETRENFAKNNEPLSDELSRGIPLMEKLLLGQNDLYQKEIARRDKEFAIYRCALKKGYELSEADEKRYIGYINAKMNDRQDVKDVRKKLNIIKEKKQNVILSPEEERQLSDLEKEYNETKDLVDSVKLLGYHRTNKYKPKTISIEMKNNMAEKVGGKLSSRAVVHFKDASGRTVKGFFTEDTYNDFEQMFTKRVNEGMDSDWMKDYGEILEAFSGKGNKIIDMFSDLFNECSIEWRNNTAKDDTAKKLFIGDRRNGERLKVNTGVFKYEIEQFLKKHGVKQELFDKIHEEFLGESRRFLNGFADLIDMFEDANIEHNMYSMMEQGGNINRRNIAMTDYGELLGMSGLLARSVPMVIKQNGKVVRGNLMENAKGMPVDYICSNNPAFQRQVSDTSADLFGEGNSNVLPIVVTPEAIKEINNLQILDFLCGNIDRHAANMFYKFDFSDPNAVKLTGVQGIDNDASFGSVDFKGSGVKNRMSRINDIKVIDEKTADEILNLSIDKLDNKLRLSRLSKKELDSAHERLKALQDRIRKRDGITVLNDEQWKEQSLENLAYRKQGERSSNIFGLVQYAVNKSKDPEPKFNPQKETLITDDRVSKQIITTESYNLHDQIEAFSKIKDDFNKTDLKGSTPEFMDMYNQLSTAIDHMKVVKNLVENDKKLQGMIPDKYRNALSEDLKKLKNVSETYISKKSTNPTFERGKQRLHFAKDLAACAEFSRQSIREDAIEVEKMEASLKAKEVQRSINKPAEIKEDNKVSENILIKL